MNWINLRTELLRSPSFANAKSGAIETWLRVLAFCCEQENGGCIINGASWNDRAWMMTCGVTKAEVENAYPLLHDDGVAVFVDGYPEEKEAEVRAKRKAGKRGGKRSAALRAESNASPEVPSTASNSPSSCASTEGEGKENSNKKENRTKKRRVARAALECVAFKEFWGQYPRKEAIAKAEEAWIKHDCASKLPIILTAIRAAKPHWLSGAPHFIPLPASWLNGRRWEDELLPRSAAFSKPEVRGIV